MNRGPTMRLLGAGAALCALAALVGSAMGQDSKPAQPADPLLGGPAVKDAGLPGEKRSFSGAGKGARDRFEERGIPPRIFNEALRALGPEKSDEPVRLTAGQEEMIRTIQSEFQSAVRAYALAHREEVAGLRSGLSAESRAKFDQRTRAAGLGSIGDKDRPRDKVEGRAKVKGKGKEAPEPRDEMAPAQTPEGKGAAAEDERIKRRLVEILEGAPKPKDAQTSVMAILTDTQKAVVRGEIERLRKAAERPKQAADTMDDLPPNARERLKNLPPEQREEAIKRLKERRAQRQAGQDKPAPGVEEVDVPPTQQEPPKPKRKN